MARITHGYLTRENFQLNLSRLLEADEAPPDESKAELYLGFYGFRRMQDEILVDDYPNRDLFYHPGIGGTYTFASLPRSRVRVLGESVVTRWQQIWAHRPRLSVLRSLGRPNNRPR